MQNNQLAVVIIGRNEGQRLLNCLRSVCIITQYIVYVDSGSTDNSIEIAQQFNAHIIHLDLTQAFTAARARNAGLNYIINTYPELKYVQFIDGDCELITDWINQGLHYLETHLNDAVVCGRRRERFPKQSIYNFLCDLEWNTPIGETKACGGDALMRIQALKMVQGFNETLIAGEEPELCFRLRQNHWKIYRLAAEMTLHDAAMTKFSQWWQRAIRSGYAYAHGFHLHGDSVEHYCRHELYSIYFWVLILPLSIILLTIINSLAFILGIIYPLQWLRITLKTYPRFNSINTAMLYASFMLLAKIPQLLGIIKFWNIYYFQHKIQLIEYK